MRASLTSLSLRSLPVVLALAWAGQAEAGPRRKRPPRPDLAAAVASGDPVTVCKAAIAAVAAGDHARASLVLPRCDDPAAVALVDEARRARAAVDKVAAREDWSPVELMVRPAGAEATLAIDAFPGLPLAEGRYLLPAGSYRITGSNPHGAAAYELTLSAGSRALVLLDLPTSSPAAAARVLDLGEDGEPVAAPMAGPPPVIKRGSLLPERFRRGLQR